MKHGKRPTVAQRKIMGSKRLNSENWLVIKDEPKQMTIVYKRDENKTKVISK